MKRKKKGITLISVITVVLLLSLMLPIKHNRQTVIIALSLVCIGILLLKAILPVLPAVWNFCMNRIYHIRNRSMIKNEPDIESLLIRQISYQITGKLKSAYPDATWNFQKTPQIKRLISGNAVRIRTYDTKDYNFAEVCMDQYGNLDIKMMTIEALKEMTYAEAGNSNETLQVDPESWYTLIGKPLLTTVVGNLQARGHQKLFISENGEMYVKSGEVTGILEHFPPRKYWTALIDIFLKDELDAKETNQALELSWGN